MIFATNILLINICRQ